MSNDLVIWGYICQLLPLRFPLPIFQTFPEKEVSAMDVKPHGWIFLVLGVMSWFEYTVGTSRHFEWSYLHDTSTAQWSSSRAVAFTIEASIAAIAKHALLLCLLAFGCTFVWFPVCFGGIFLPVVPLTHSTNCWHDTFPKVSSTTVSGGRQNQTSFWHLWESTPAASNWIIFRIRV